MYIGRLIGKSALELWVRCNYDVDLCLGELLVIEDEEKEKNYLIRVVDIRHGADASEGWIERTAGNIMKIDEEKMEYFMEDKKTRLYKIAICTPLGYVRSHKSGSVQGANNLMKAKSLPQHFSKARRTVAEDYKAIAASLGDLKIGWLRSGEAVIRMAVGIPGRAIPHHIGVFATTGMGKSNLMKVLAGAVLASGKYSMLIFDPHGEYYTGGGAGRRGLYHHALAKERLYVYSTRRLEGRYSTIKISYSEIKVEDFAVLYEFTQSQRELLYAASSLYGKDWLMAMRTKGVAEIYEDFEEKYHEPTINVVKRRVERLFSYGIISDDREISITRSVVSALYSGGVVLVDTSGMLESEELLVSSVLARAIFESNRRLYASEPEQFEHIPPVLVTMEEAQRVLSSASGTIFSRIAREGRKFKVGICAISQQPKLIHREILSQFNTLFILGLADRRDRECLAESAKQDVSALNNEIQSLMPGEAIITSPFTPFPLPVKIYMYEDYLATMRGEVGGRGGSDAAKMTAVDEDFF